jgi:hypothetical protein
MSVGFRPTEADAEILSTCKRAGETNSDVLRRGPRALQRQEWEERAREDMARIAASGEDVSGSMTTRDAFASRERMSP